MTHDQIERQVERQFDVLDAKLMSGKITQAEYDLVALAINEQAEYKYRHCINREYLG